MRRSALVLVLALAVPAAAQPPEPQGELPSGHPPLGPRDVMQQAQEQREQREQEQREQRAPTPEDQLHRILRGEDVPQVVAQESADVGRGRIRVRVVDGGAGRPVSGQVVDVGVLEAGRHERLSGRTAADGSVTFDGLEPGGERAYRVDVPYQGATYLSPPFRLPPDRGYDVRVTRLPTTRDERTVLSLLTRTFLELRDTRLHVVQRVQLVNVGGETYVFPEDGKLVELPEGFTAWQWQEVMTDQRLSQVDEGFRVRGSLPPGRLDLTWAFDLPVSGTQMTIDLPVPWRTFAARVEANAPEGMELDVEELPRGQIHEAGEQRVWVAERRYRPEDRSPSRLRVEVSGIPGPGPLRLLALGAAIVLLAGSILFLLLPGRRPLDGAEALARRRKELLDEASAIERSFRAEEIGPKYRQRQMDAVVAELATVLRRQDAARATSEKSEASKKGGPATPSAGRPRR